MYRQLISNSWKACLLFVCVFFSGITVKADDSLYSPNKKIGVSWDNPAKGLRVIYKKGDSSIATDCSTLCLIVKALSSPPSQRLLRCQ